GCCRVRPATASSSQYSCFHFEFFNEFLSGLNFDAAFACRRLRQLQYFQPGGGIDAEGIDRLFDDRLFLGLHDGRQGREARLVEAKIGGDDRRHVELYGLVTAIDFAGHDHRAALDHHFRGEGALRPAKQCSEHLTGLIAVIVDRLLAQDDQIRGFLEGDRFKDFCYRERLQFSLKTDQDAAVGAQRQGRTNGFFGSRRPDRDADDFGSQTLLFQPDSLLDGDFIERIDGHLQIGEVDTRAIGLDPNLGVGIDNSFNGYHNFHWLLLAPFKTVLQATCSLIFGTAPPARRPSMSFSSNPSSRRISSVCSPRLGPRWAGTLATPCT